MSNKVSAKRDILENLNFVLLKDGRKYTARCLFCKQILSNIATQRLQGHRNRCKKPVQENQNNDVREGDVVDVMDMDSSIEISAMDTSSSSLYDSLATTTTTTSTNATTKTNTTITVSSSLPTSSITPSTSSIEFSTTSPDILFKQPKSKTSSITKFMDTITKNEEQDINSCIARFFFGCNIPLNVIESSPFKELIKKLRPAYATSLPSRKILSTKLLDEEYDRQIKLSRDFMGEESVLLIDGWKNTASNTKTVVTMLHNANDEKTFLNAWDLSGESETSDRLAELVEESIKLAQELYKTKVYCVISDNAANMVKMGSIVNIWHSTCNAHIANLLSKDILNNDVMTDLTAVLKEFRHTDLETAILEKGGTKIKLPSSTRWCTYRDCCICFKNNLKYMRELVIDCKKIKPNIKKLLFEDEFIEQIEQMITDLSPVAIFLNKVQSANCCLAEAANLWLSMEANKPQLQIFFENRKKQALNKFALTAFYMNPYFDKKKLNASQTNIVTDFLFDNLDEQGIYELDLYINRKEYFNILYSKTLNKDATLYWRMCSLKYPTISELARKLINIPASSAQIERLFSNWGYIHSDIRNRLTFDRSKKLLHIYYNMKINNFNEE